MSCFLNFLSNCLFLGYRNTTDLFEFILYSVTLLNPFISFGSICFCGCTPCIFCIFLPIGSCYLQVDIVSPLIFQLSFVLFISLARTSRTMGNSGKNQASSSCPSSECGTYLEIIPHRQRGLMGYRL